MRRQTTMFLVIFAAGFVFNATTYGQAPNVEAEITLLTPANNAVLTERQTVQCQAAADFKNLEETAWIQCKVNVYLYKHNQTADTWELQTLNKGLDGPGASNSTLLVPQQFDSVFENGWYPRSKQGYYKVVGTMSARFQGGNFVQIGDSEIHHFHVVPRN